MTYYRVESTGRISRIEHSFVLKTQDVVVFERLDIFRKLYYWSVPNVELFRDYETAKLKSIEIVTQLIERMGKDGDKLAIKLKTIPSDSSELYGSWNPHSN